MVKSWTKEDAIQTEQIDQNSKVSYYLKKCKTDFENRNNLRTRNLGQHIRVVGGYTPSLPLLAILLTVHQNSVH